MQFSGNFNSLSVGNRTIDSEHQKISAIVNDISQLILVDHIVALSVAVKMLADCLQEYFWIEENFAQAVNFDFTKHRLAHQALLNNFRVITDKIISQNGKFSKLERKVYTDSLNELLIQHIKVDSKSLKVVLDTCFYDFKPPESEAPQVKRGCGWVLQVNE